MTPPSDDDSDRAAILARRQRFIAIALSGLASGAACTAPQPCLNVAQPNDSNATPDPTTPADTATPETPPQPCLKVAPPEDPPPPETPPQPCLEVVPPKDDPAAPRPCLNVAPPKDDPAAPRPCLKVAQPDPEPAPKPTPCLKIAPK
jgi:hypothetical protein